MAHNYDAEQIKTLIQEGKTYKQIADVVGGHPDTVRKWARKQPWYDEVRTFAGGSSSSTNLSRTQYGKGSMVNKLVEKRIDESSLLTEDELLEVHGFDPKEFKIKSATSNEWTTPMQGEGFHNYQSKILVEPKTPLDLSPEELAELLSELKPLDVSYSTQEGKRDLYIPLSDMHFGHNSLEEYTPVLRELTRNIEVEPVGKVVLSIHGDYFHVDNFLNTTERGTRVDDVDFAQQIEDGYQFMVTLIETAVANSNRVEVTYLPGNHAPSVDYMFVNALRRLFPQVVVDDTIEEYKISTLNSGRVLCMGHHGDKVKNFNRLLAIMVSQYPKEWGAATSRYLFTGHFHHEKSLSEAGVTHYQVQSPSKPSSYDKRMGYITSEEGMQVFEFRNGRRSAVFYIPV